MKYAWIEKNKRNCINLLVASSMKTSKVQGSPRCSNQRCSLPSICTNSPRLSRRSLG